MGGLGLGVNDDMVKRFSTAVFNRSLFHFKSETVFATLTIKAGLNESVGSAFSSFGDDGGEVTFLQILFAILIREST